MDEFDSDLENNHIDYNEMPEAPVGAEDFRIPPDHVGGGGLGTDGEPLKEIPIIAPTRLDSPEIGKFGLAHLLIVAESGPQGKDSVPSVHFFNAEGKHGSQTKSGEKISIGRTPDNAVVINDKSVSRTHAEIIHRSDGYWINDTGSKNRSSLESVEIAEEGEEQIPHGEWRLIPPGRTIQIDFSQTPTAIVNRGGVYVMEIDDMRQRELLLRRNTPLIVGRAGCDINLPFDETVSQEHATIIITDAGVLIHNNSKNGTELRSESMHDAPPPADTVNFAYMQRRLLRACLGESMGGNAGGVTGIHGNRVPAVGLNFRINRKTGEMVVFTNYGNAAFSENPDITVCTFHVASDENYTIKDTVGTDRLSDTGRAVLAATVARWNSRGEVNE